MIDQKIVIRQKVYHGRIDQYESMYQEFVSRMAIDLFPDFHVVDVELKVESLNVSEGSKKCDLVFIRKDYSEWWVVEVEMSHHSYNGHVYPQVKVLSDGLYGGTCLERQVNSILSGDSGCALDREKLSVLIESEDPRVLVIVNQEPPEKDEWRNLEKLNRVKLGVLARYRSEPDMHEVAVYSGPDLSESIQSKIRGTFNNEVFEFQKAKSLLGKTRKFSDIDGGVGFDTVARRIKEVRYAGRSIKVFITWYPENTSLKIYLSAVADVGLFKNGGAYHLSFNEDNPMCWDLDSV